MPSKKQKVECQSIEVDELLMEIRKLEKIEARLKAELNEVVDENDVFTQALNCTSAEEFDVIDAPIQFEKQANKPLSPKSFRRLRTSASDLNQHMFYSLTGVKAKPLSDTSTLVEFVQPKGYESSPLMLLSLEQSDNKAKVKSHNLPPIVPVEEISEKYLEAPEVSEIAKFCYFVRQYITFYFNRHQQYRDIKKFGCMSRSVIYINTRATVISFSLNIDLEEKILNVEFKLNYHPLSALPFSVSYMVLPEEQSLLTADLTAELDELKQLMEENPLPEVIRVKIQGDTHGLQDEGRGRSPRRWEEITRQKTKKDESLKNASVDVTSSNTSDESSVVYDMFL